MKVLQVIPNLGSGGAERFVVDLSNEIAENNGINDVMLLTFRIKNPISDLFYLSELTSKVTYKNCKYIKSKFGLFYSQIKLFLLIKKNKPDVVHLHSEISLFIVFLSILFNRKPKYIQTLHCDAFIHKNNVAFPLFMQRFIYRKLVRIYTISARNEESFYQCYNFHSNGIIVNGRKPMKLSDKHSEVVSEIEMYKKDVNTLVFLNVARCNEIKNHTMLIDAFNKYIQSNTNAILLIIGNGFDSKLGNELKLKSNKNIFFLGEKSNVADYYSVSDAFCLSSLSEGMPLTLIEALYFGIPIISTPTSGAIDLKNSGVGYITADFSATSLCNIMLEFTKNKNIINKKLIKQIYFSHFSIEQCANLYYTEYKI